MSPQLLDLISYEMQKKAKQIISKINLYDAWKSINAYVNAVGSFRTGLMMKHQDIDFHIYSDIVTVNSSFDAVKKIAAIPNIYQIQYINLLYTPEKCIEWHLKYIDIDSYETCNIQTLEKHSWQIDMIHIQNGSKYDGFFEKVADRIVNVITPEMKTAILRIKYEAPNNNPVTGIRCYQAVIQDGVRTYKQFLEWEKKNAPVAILDWMP